MLTDEQLVILETVFRTGDVEAALLAHCTQVSKGDSPVERAARLRYWASLRKDPSACEYLAFLREDAFANGGVTLHEHIGDLKGDLAEAKEDLGRMRRAWSLTPGAPAAIASLHASVLRARELQARASGIYMRRESVTVEDTNSDDGARTRGIKVEWA